jgi:glycosyltransferase involved in cell wall biosynthesis
LNISFVSGHACIRCQKEALPLLEKGHKVHLVAGKIPGYYEQYSSFSYASGVNNYIEAIKMLDKVVDVFHVHNEPSWFVTLIKEHSNKPVILDVHDSWLARMTEEEAEKMREEGKDVSRYYSEERNNFQLADALVFPSKPFAKQIMDEYGLTQPHLILPSYLPESFYRYNMDHYWGGLVYEGRVDLGKEIEKDPNLHGFRYCDYEDTAKEAQKLGLQFHIYTTRNDEAFKGVYEGISYLHEPRDVDKLLKSLTRHDWGLVGNVNPTPEWEVAFPNKLFEYIAACVPVVAINAKECGKFLKKHKIGIEVKSLDELKERWDEHTEIRKTLIKKRQQFTMNANIHLLEELYGKVL